MTIRKHLLGLAAIIVVSSALAACSSGLPSRGQASAKVSSIGLTAGTDPASGGFSANIGYKNASLVYNPGSTGPANEEGGGGELISADRGGQLDARAILQWDEVDAEAAEGGVLLGLGSGVGTGWAATIIACGIANGAGGTDMDCTGAATMR